jgi:copper chaperone CopZ
MSCNGCERSVETAVESIEGVDSADADHEGATVEVIADESVSDADLEDAVREAGYEAVA